MSRPEVDPSALRASRGIFPVAFLGYYAVTSSTLLPALVSDWVRHLAISDDRAGLIATGSLLGQTAGLLLGMALIRRRPLVHVALLGLVPALLCDLLSVIGRDPGAMLAFRAANGVGQGLLLSAVVNWFGRRPAPERGFGALATFQFLMPVPILLLAPYVERQIGHAGIYGMMLALGAAALPWVRLLTVAGEDGPRAAAGGPAENRHGAALGSVAAMALFGAGAVGSWAFMVRYGELGGIATGTALWAVALSSACGVPGSLAVVLVAGRASRLGAMAAGFAAFIAVLLCFALRPPSAMGFYVQLGALNFVWAFLVPFMQGTQAALDRSGRLPIWGMVAASIGSGLGPVLFGALGTGGDYRIAFLYAAMALALAGMAILPAGLRIEARTGSVAA